MSAPACPGNMPSPDDLLSLAISAAGEAGEGLARRFRQRRVGGTRYKGPKSLVTEADTEAEAIIVGRMRKAFPTHAIVAEEGSEGGSASAAPFTWYIDPLDGTTNFARGIPHFAVSIGVANARGEMIAAVVYDPILSEMFTATSSQPSTLNDEALRVSEIASLDRAILSTGFALRRYSAEMERPMATFQGVVREAEDIRRLASATLDFAYVAAGRLDGYWEEGLSPWDVAAGMLLVTQAGGRVSPLGVGESVLVSGNVCATNLALHDSLLARVRRPG